MQLVACIKTPPISRAQQIYEVLLSNGLLPKVKAELQATAGTTQIQFCLIPIEMAKTSFMGGPVGTPRLEFSKELVLSMEVGGKLSAEQGSHPIGCRTCLGILTAMGVVRIQKPILLILLSTLFSMNGGIEWFSLAQHHGLPALPPALQSRTSSFTVLQMLALIALNTPLIPVCIRSYQKEPALFSSWRTCTII